MRVFLVAIVLIASALPATASEGQSHLGIPDALWLPLNLALFIFVLYWFVGKPISRFLASRRDNIATELEEAQKKLVEAEDLRAQVLERLEQVEVEINEIKERAEREAHAEAERIAEASQAEEERFLNRVEDEISRRHSETRTELAKETAALTAQLAHELLAKEITAEDRERILKRSLEAMAAIREGE
jgi:F-type H+-transporting ATPase subunit b